ncbi:unnamed protein product [Cylindrotheca closterium]|uniref:Uncharacterized protein n=3 Tax=Cylindrotheca closterium TaxID=2856 RepID=A0AAD2CRM2_9STRA|nr:unnamed protein product [Cylindrotheca closterium]CAJ1944152.1 unnamed protein product [Cylindrotheca closterium]
MFSFIFMNNNIINTIINTITMPLALTLIVMLVAAMPVIAQQLISRVAVAPAVHSVIATQTTTIVAGVRAIFGSISIAAVGRTVSDAIGGITNIIKSFIGNATVLNSQIFALPTSETYLQLIVRAPRDLVLMATRAIIVRATRAIVVRATRSLVLFAARELVLRVSTCTDLVILGSSDLVPFGPQDLIIKVCAEALAHCITPVFAFVGQEVLNLPMNQTFSSEGNMMPWSPSILPIYSFGTAMTSTLSSLTRIMTGFFKLTLKTCVPVFADLIFLLLWTLASFICVMMNLANLTLQRSIETTKPVVRVFTDLISALSSWVCMWISALSIVSCTMTSLVKLAVQGMLEQYPGKVKYYWVVVLPNFCLKVGCDYLGQGPQRTNPPSSGKTIIGSYKRKMAKKRYDQKFKEMRERTERSFRLEAQIPGTRINLFQTEWEWAVIRRSNDETTLLSQE